MGKQALAYISLIVAALWIGAVIASGCQYLDDNSDNECDPQPLSCNDTRPTEGHLVIVSTINGRNTHVPITVFRGDFELGDVVRHDTLTGSGKTYTLPIDQYYSVIAEYIQADGDTVIALDADDVQVDKTDYCEGPCYKVDEGYIDVRLHFPKSMIDESKTKTRYWIHSLSSRAIR